MAQPRNFICRSLQAEKTCNYGCTPHRIMCHAFFDNTCSVREARYCDNGWHERVEYDTKLQYEARKSSTKELNNGRPEIRLRSVAPSRKSTKRSRSEKPPRTPEEDTDTDTETQTNISLCQLGLFEGIPEPELLETAYRTKMHETQGNARDKALSTKAFKFVYAQLKRKESK